VSRVQLTAEGGVPFPSSPATVDLPKCNCLTEYHNGGVEQGTIGPNRRRRRRATIRAVFRGSLSSCRTVQAAGHSLIDCGQGDNKSRMLQPGYKIYPCRNVEGETCVISDQERGGAVGT
jgi:hypothetical protein